MSTPFTLSSHLPPYPSAQSSLEVILIQRRPPRASTQRLLEGSPVPLGKGGCSSSGFWDRDITPGHPGVGDFESLRRGMLGGKKGHTKFQSGHVTSSFNSRVSQSISSQTLLYLVPKHQAEKRGTKFSSIRSHKARSKSSYGRPQRPRHITSFSTSFFLIYAIYRSMINQNLASCWLFHCKSQMHIWGPRTFPTTFHHHGILGGPDTA